MASGSNFHRLHEPEHPELEHKRLILTFDGRTIEARSGDSVAAALIAAGVTVTRTTPVSGAARGPYCMMGVCFECLMEIDGVQNVQGCMVQVCEGMTVRSMTGARTVSDAWRQGDG